ncbi:enoyl-CoA hydratase-related protein [Pseudidiomarina donghaiensis]|uniref:Gamma-carboxygeranoyl-CoA hydratase n=1 Tax=Pseudidiomarina donghaiensis TaxID=519452 RepID=A0A432XLX8_9GAMM|nr:enoyl-CoA hydratase-related protein [Pseudidiomarina donghaiensis]RUO49708.1 gamma-carboxygeranoyl-CoA hydratase [Pseudidiomarina donghaiensis]SFV21700.1 methylglutaconyl-CoA hydratase [Pseudidiomarina donghaiensis]
MNYHAITLSVADHVAWLTLNRPEVHNAFDDRMIAELLDALAAVRNNNQVRVLVLRSEGKNFSAGADLGWMRSMAAKNYDENIADAAELSRLMQELDELPQPTIALVQGAAFGGAVGLAACCDIALATPASSFCLSEVKIGLIPAVISPYVMRAMGTRQARRYMLTAERFNAEEALRIGLVHDIAEDLKQAAQPLIEALINNSPAAVAAAKSLAMAVDQQPLNANTRQLTIERIAEIRVSAEGQEGLSAFLEKRAPNWKTTNE